MLSFHTLVFDETATSGLMREHFYILLLNFSSVTFARTSDPNLIHQLGINGSFHCDECQPFVRFDH